MNQKTILSITSSTLVTTLAVAGITYAATPASNDTSLLNKGTVEVDSLKVGNPNSGGVTFFNGTIVNESAPVTFGDDVRVDGRIWRGENQGPALGDNKPFIINDDAQVAGTFTVGGTDIFAAIDAKSDKSAVTTNATNIASNDTDIAANTTAINNNASNISSKADEAQTDAALLLKANAADVYTQAQVDSGFVSQSSPTWSTRTGYIFYDAISALPENEAVNYDITGFGRVLTLDTAVNTDVDFFVPVQLPKGVTLTNVKLEATDTNTIDGSIDVNLISYDYSSLLGTETVLANVFTGGLAGSDEASLSHVTDPENNKYFFKIDFIDGNAEGDVFLSGILLEYTYTSPY